MKARKILEKVLASAANVSFADIRNFGGGVRISVITCEGQPSHFCPRKRAGLVNLQEVKGKAKPYQVRQFLKLVEEYNLALEEDGP
jgi:hypothetical protein